MCVCACVRAWVRAVCVRAACVRVRACVRVCGVGGYFLLGDIFTVDYDTQLRFCLLSVCNLMWFSSLSCLYSEVSVTQVREWRFIKIIYDDDDDDDDDDNDDAGFALGGRKDGVGSCRAVGVRRGG